MADLRHGARPVPRSGAGRSLHQVGDVVLTDEGRIGFYYTSGPTGTTYGSVAFLDDAEPNLLALPWSALQAPTGLWRCHCPKFWQIATAPVLHCDNCGASRG